MRPPGASYSPGSIPPTCIPQHGRIGGDRIPQHGRIGVYVPADGLLYDGTVIEPGDQAPDFALPDQDGREVELSDFRGQMVVLYFYPKADTPGCTTQACGIRDHRADYVRAGATVLGISPDSVQKIKRFAEKHELAFPLLADEGHAVADRCGVWVQKSMYGRAYWGNERTTFVIDADGAVASVLRKVKPAEHDALVLAALQEQAGAR